MEKLKEEIPSEKQLNEDHPLKKKKESAVSERIAEIFSIQQKNTDKDLIEKVTIGSFLRRERETKQFSLKKISNRTKISITILEQLESDNFIQLPNKAYVRGFVRSYAQVLNLNLELCQEILEHTYSSIKGSERSVKKITAFDDPPIKSKAPMIQLSLVIGAVIALFAFGVYTIRNTQQEVHTVVERPIIPIAVNSKTPLKNSEKHLATAKSQVVTPAKEEVKVETITGTVEKPVPTAAPTAAPSLNTKPILLGQKTEIVTDKQIIKPHELAPDKKNILKPTEVVTEKKPVVEAKTEKTEKIETKNMEEVLYTEVSKEESDKNKEFLPDNIRYAMIPGLQNVFINAALGDSWITYKKDQEPIKKFVLKKGKTLLIRGKEIRVFLGNTGASKVYLNNKLINLNAPTGVKSLVFPQENSNKYKIPLFIYKESGEVITSENI